MSRVGLNPITIPDGVEFNFSEQLFSAKSQKGSLSIKLAAGFNVVKDDSGALNIKRPDDTKESRSKHGLYRALIANIFEGLSIGFKKELELHGVGYRASNKGQMLDLSLGYSHNIVLEVCKEVILKTESEKGQSPKIILESFDKELIGSVAAMLTTLNRGVNIFRVHDVKEAADAIKVWNTLN